MAWICIQCSIKEKFFLSIIVIIHFISLLLQKQCAEEGALTTCSVCQAHKAWADDLGHPQSPRGAGRAARQRRLPRAAQVGVCPWGSKLRFISLIYFFLFRGTHFATMSTPWGLEFCLFSTTPRNFMGVDTFLLTEEGPWRSCVHAGVCSCTGLWVFRADVPGRGWEPHQEWTPHILLPLPQAPHILAVPHSTTADWPINWTQGHGSNTIQKELRIAKELKFNAIK